MNTYNYKGVVEEIGETKSFGQSGFTKREIVVGNDIDSTSQYPNPVAFTCKKERCALCDTVKKGDRVSVQFTIDGRRWDGPNGVRYFTDLTVWKIEKVEDAGAAAAPEPAVAPEDVPTADDPDELPF